MDFILNNSILTHLNESTYRLFNENSSDYKEVLISFSKNLSRDLGNVDWNAQNVVLILSGIASLFLIVNIIRFFFVPFYVKKTFEDSNGINRSINNMRRMGNMPPPFPKLGWYRIAWVWDLPRENTMHRVDCLGKNLLLIRGKDGKVSCLDAYCPHLGAELAGGMLKEKDGETCIECPFHGWMFKTDGSCASVPYTDTIPTSAKVKRYEILEQNDMILFWNDENPASYQPIYVPQISNGQMKYHGVAEYNVSCHVQEIPENGADVEHLGFLHTPMFGPFLYNWSAEWSVHPENPQCSRIDMKTWFTCFGYRIPLLWVNPRVVQNGPGLVFLDLKMPIGNMYSIETVTPLKPMLQRLTHVIYCDWWIPRFVAKLAFYGLVNQLERDIPIWNAKTYQDKPSLAKTEGSILKFRRWFKQFYGDEINTTTGNLRVENSRDW
eukprot:TRINITY_DN8296_c0_g1_i1.p1 TRINITY_DN8296_c0_g1~~TRINITY_DN8296_c0_g1_i1.p1  ORF type:complete len:437 (+),score=97.11 TRINITY_DN8296_c0_g1_i1:26-1336(+)